MISCKVPNTAGISEVEITPALPLAVGSCMLRQPAAVTSGAGAVVLWCCVAVLLPRVLASCCSFGRLNNSAFGGLQEVTLNYTTLADIESKSQYYGSTCGRVANRIAKGTFSLDGPNSLHGGAAGFDKVSCNGLQGSCVIFSDYCDHSHHSKFGVLSPCAILARALGSSFTCRAQMGTAGSPAIAKSS